MILGAESGLRRGGDTGAPWMSSPWSPSSTPEAGCLLLCVSRAVCSTDPQLPDSSFTWKRPQAGPAHRATTPLSSCLRPLLGTSYLVCSVLSIDYALTVCTGKGANRFLATTPPGK